MVSRPLLAAVLPLVALLGACGGAGEAGETYPQRAGDVRQVLRGLEMPAVIGAYATDVRVVQEGDGSVVWFVGNDGNYAMRFVARTEAVDAEHTRVTVEMKPPTDSPDDPAKKRLEENASAANVYVMAMVEQIDATLENRPFDHSKIAAATAIGVAANIGQLSAQLDEQVAREREREAKNMADAYANEGRTSSSGSNSYNGYGSAETQFGKPMTDASPGTY